MKRVSNPDIYHDQNIVFKKARIVEANNAPGGLPLMNPYAVTRKAPTDLFELVNEIENADNFVKTTACSKLQVIAEQIRLLQKQAKDVILTAQRDNRLHHASCNFVKCPGSIYHLYKRKNGEEYFSMLSPDEWGVIPNEYIGSYRLETDLSWTEANDTNRTRQMQMIEAVYNTVTHEKSTQNLEQFRLLQHLESSDMET